MKNNNHPVQEELRVRLSGVVTVPHRHSPNCATSGQWKERLISSFVEARFQNVLARATVLRRVDWFWHCFCSTHISNKAVAIIADNANDYRQILIKHNQLASTLQDLDPVAEVLLLINPVRDYVFSTNLETLEMFSTHVVFVQKYEKPNCGVNVSSAWAKSAAEPVTSTAYANSVGNSIS